MLFHFLGSDPVGVDDLCIPTWGIFLFSTCLFVHLSHPGLSPTKGGLSQAQEPHLGPRESKGGHIRALGVSS